MQIVKFPERASWFSLVERPHIDVSKLKYTVSEILQAVKMQGDEALKLYEYKFDHVRLESLEVTDEEKEKAIKLISNELREALTAAYKDIFCFHQAQKFTPIEVETAPGVVCWQKSVPIEKVGLYIPGGTAPLFSTVLMLATPAKIAGCREIVLCTPPSKEGKVHPAIIAAADMAGVSRIFKIGGVQAIGAMAYGTVSVPKVFKIFGPGNQYVMAAKQQVSMENVAIDMPAGPSEICIIADHTARPDFVAADLLSQAEHGVDSQVMLLTTSENLIEAVKEEIDRQLLQLPRKEMAKKTLDNSRIILLHDAVEAIELSNLYAPEHLILNTKDYKFLAEKVVNAGSVFLGQYACESVGDYASGTNHTLPTHHHATAYSGVNLDSFNRKITFQHLTPQGVQAIGKTVEILAEYEQLQAHKNAMSMRLKYLNQKGKINADEIS